MCYVIDIDYLKQWVALQRVHEPHFRLYEECVHEKGAREEHLKLLYNQHNFVEDLTFARVELYRTMGHVCQQLYSQNQFIVLFN